MPLAPGTRFGPYEITAQIGVGGMGEVYRVTGTVPERRLAPKVQPKLTRLHARSAIVLALTFFVAAAEVGAQVDTVGGGPRTPVPPATITRDGSGGVTVRAQRVITPLELDGRLDEAVYTDVLPMSGFIQVEPQSGALATEQTDVWLFFDETQVYVAIRAWDSELDQLVATEGRRDNPTIFNGNDNVGFSFDTFYDRRNSVVFFVNPLGAKIDAQATNESQVNRDWNPVWDVVAGRFEGGWTIEAAIPFKSLRYGSERSQLWGFNVIRSKSSTNEISFLTRMPAARGRVAIFQASLAATVVDLEVPADSSNLDVKPYVTSNVTTDVGANVNALKGDIGLDVKYALTEGLAGDLTFNTDFAQVEADQQQVNLTRFSLFFPEKREFFIENQGTFSFGGVAATGRGGGNGGTPILFYSRRIGLEGGTVVPIRVGGRVTGRIGRYSLGVLNIQTGDVSPSGRATNFSVLRLKRDILRRSSIGLLLTGRSVDLRGGGTNVAYGLDGTFGFFDNLTLNTYWARTRSDGLSDDDTSYRAQLNYRGDRYGVQAEHLRVGDNFNPEVGLVRRDDMRRTFGEFRFSPRLRSSASIRRLSWTGSVNHITNGAGLVETRKRIGEFAVEFQNSDRFSVEYTGSYEFLTRPFRIAPGISIPVGGYHFDAAAIRFSLGQQRQVRANLSVSHGSFYSGDKTTLSASQGRIRLTDQISIEPTYSLNRVSLREGDFTTQLLGTRATYTITPVMFVSALVQYNSGNDTMATNARLRWEYRPGSELFVVYNEERETRVSGFPGLANRAVIVKVNRLFRF